MFYDGLAQDVHEGTAFGSVTLMLFLIMLMENRRRGLFLGHRIPQLMGAGDTVRRYHGYYFSWAIIYTFWYHPVEMTPGHLAGFAYMSLLLLQSSLFLPVTIPTAGGRCSWKRCSPCTALWLPGTS